MLRATEKMLDDGKWGRRDLALFIFWAYLIIEISIGVHELVALGATYLARKKLF